MAAPIAADPETRWRHQSNSDSAAANSPHDLHPVAGSYLFIPYGIERAFEALAYPSGLCPDMSPLNLVRNVDTHLVRPIAAAFWAL